MLVSIPSTVSMIMQRGKPRLLCCYWLQQIGPNPPGLPVTQCTNQCPTKLDTTDELPWTFEDFLDLFQWIGGFGNHRFSYVKYGAKSWAFRLYFVPFNPANDCWISGFQAPGPQGCPTSRLLAESKSCAVRRVINALRIQCEMVGTADFDDFSSFWWLI